MWVGVSACGAKYITLISFIMHDATFTAVASAVSNRTQHCYRVYCTYIATMERSLYKCALQWGVLLLCWRVGGGANQLGMQLQYTLPCAREC